MLRRFRSIHLGNIILSQLLALFLLALPAYCDTLAVMREDCRVLVRDSGSSRRRFSDATLNGFINEGQRETISDIQPIRKSIEFELVAGTTYYSLPSDFVSVRRVTRDYLALREESPSSLDKLAEWQSVAGLPTRYFVSFASRTKVGFYPWPDGSTSTGTIRLEYNASAVDMTDDAETPFNGIAELQQYGHILAHYCAYRAAMIYGQTDLAAVYLNDYQKDVKRMGETATDRPNYNPGITPAVNTR